MQLWSVLRVIREIDDEMVRMSFLMRCRSVFLLYCLLPMFESRSYLNQYPTMNAICYNVQWNACMIIFWKEFEAGSMFSTNTDTLTERVYYLIISLICLERYRMMLWKNCKKFPANRWQAILTPRNYTLSQGKEGREIQGAILIEFLLIPEETDGPSSLKVEWYKFRWTITNNRLPIYSVI